MNVSKHTIGVIGGMGSHAANSFFHELIQAQTTANDQEYLEVLVHNNTRIPDRTAGITQRGPSPLEELQRSALLLEQGGCSIIVMACLTAYYYAEQIEAVLQSSRLYNIVQEAAADILLKQGVQTVGIFASEGSISTGIWDRAFADKGIRINTLSPDDHENYFNKAIYGCLKGGNVDKTAKDRVIQGCTKLIELGADVTIGACSELPLVVQENDFPFPYYDVMRLTARKIVDQAHKRV
jgi:aspartate racemase